MSLLCPIDFRYGRPKMKGLFEEESRLQRLLDVEAALARAEAKVGLIPEEAASEIVRKATTKRITVKRVQELEEETRHDLMAVVLALTEAGEGDAGKYVHLGASLEKFCTEVRNLQRTEIGEVAEAFEMKKQVGSSTMAQKENPVASENVCSLSRIVRSLVTPALENVPLWHERDLTNSAAERIILPHACVLIDEMLARTAEVFRTLRVYPDRMKENLEATKGQVMAEAVMIALVGKGLGRQDAHKLVRDAAQKARTKGIHLRDALLAEPKVTKVLSRKEIEAAMDPNAYLGESYASVDAVVKRVR